MVQELSPIESAGTNLPSSVSDLVSPAARLCQGTSGQRLPNAPERWKIESVFNTVYLQKLERFEQHADK